MIVNLNKKEKIPGLIDIVNNKFQCPYCGKILPMYDSFGHHYWGWSGFTKCKIKVFDYLLDRDIHNLYLCISCEKILRNRYGRDNLTILKHLYEYVIKYV